MGPPARVPRPPQPRPGTLRRVLLRAGVFVLTAVAVLGGLELGLRAQQELEERAALARAEVLEPYWAVADPELGYRLDPRFGDHNALGLRDDPVTAKDGRFRVLVLGDSLGYYGDTPADTWVGRLEALLGRERPAARVDVVNACVKGWTTHQELAWLERDGLDLQPDLVVLGFVLNDLHRFLHSFRVRDGHILDLEPYKRVADAEEREGGSLLLRWVRWKLEDSAVLAAEPGREPYSFERSVGLRTAWRDAPWERVGRQLARLVELGRARGFRVAVVAFPVADQYRPEYLARDREYVRSPQRRLAELCAALDLPLLDLYDDLDPHEHLLHDGLHLTAAGRGAAAERVERFLLERGLVGR